MCIVKRSLKGYDIAKVFTEKLFGKEVGHETRSLKFPFIARKVIINCLINVVMYIM